MAHIDLVPEGKATGLLKRLYEEAVKRAGRVYNIVKTMSPNPPVMQASMAFYVSLMKMPGALLRKEREMLAVVTSRTNGCFY